VDRQLGVAGPESSEWPESTARSWVRRYAVREAAHSPASRSFWGSCRVFAELYERPTAHVVWLCRHGRAWSVAKARVELAEERSQPTTARAANRHPPHNLADAEWSAAVCHARPRWRAAVVMNAKKSPVKIRRPHHR